jgi:hypothetical protein
MEGGGTCRDVCRDLGISYEGRDLRNGFDATRADSFRDLGTFDFVWLHPPYFQMVRYNASDPRCLSNAQTLDAFVAALRSVLRNCRGVLKPGGKIAVLMGDGKHQGRYLGLPFRTFAAAEAEGLSLAAPEIVRFGHGSTSSRREYSTSFIPRLHDVCLVFEAESDGPRPTRGEYRGKSRPNWNRGPDSSRVATEDSSGKRVPAVTVPDTPRAPDQNDGDFGGPRRDEAKGRTVRKKYYDLPRTTCPRCSSTGPFLLDPSANFDITPDGRLEFPPGEWGLDIECDCPACGLAARLEDFCEWFEVTGEERATALREFLKTVG